MNACAPRFTKLRHAGAGRDCLASPSLDHQQLTLYDTYHSMNKPCGGVVRTNNNQAKPLPISPGQRAVSVCSAVLLKRNANSDNGSLSLSPGYLLQLSFIDYQSTD